MAILLAVGVVAAEGLRRHALYWYDVRGDYAYQFDTGSSSALLVRVAQDGLAIPEGAASWDTAILELRVASNWAGWWLEPCIEVTLGGLDELQCFERGARGLRYVLLPPSAGAGVTQVHLRGRHLDWDAQDARVVLFSSPVTDDARVLVLAPHPDDAEIAAFGLYSAHESYVATITAGNYVDGRYGGLGLDDADQDALRGQVRSWDSLVVPQLGGVSPERIVNLGYQTNTLRAFHDAARADAPAGTAAAQAIGPYRGGAVESLLGGRTASASWASVVADLVTLVEATRPDVIVAPHPALDANTDHQYTTIALLEALEALGDDTTVLLLYTNHHVLAEHYPFGPSTAMVTLPPWFGGTRFAGVYSYRLDPQAQLRKLFALEAMHDLRGPPVRLMTGAPGGVLLRRLQEAADLIRRDPFGDYSYFRRAVRPNELYFVYPPDARPAPGDFAEQPVRR